MAAITTATALKYGIPLALSIGHSIFKGRDISKAQKKAEEENRRAQAMSNLINAFSPSAQHQPYLQEPEYRPSGLTRALGAASLGYDVFSGLKSAAAGEAREKIEDEIRQQALKRGTEEAARRAGEAFTAQVPKGTEVTDEMRRVMAQFGPKGDQGPSFQAGVSGGLKTLEDDRVQRILQEENLKALEDQREERERLAAVTKGEDFAAQMPADPGTPEWDRFKSVMAQFGQREPGVQMGVSEALKGREDEAWDRLQKDNSRELHDLKKSLLSEKATRAAEHKKIEANNLQVMIERSNDNPAYFQSLEESWRVKVRPYLASQTVEKYGRTLTPPQSEELANSKAAVDAVRRLQGKLEKDKDVLGGFTLSTTWENLKSFIPFTEAGRREFQLVKSIEGVMRSLAKAKETGVLTDFDWDFWLEQGPNVHDHYESTTKETMNRMLEELLEESNLVIEGLRSGGYAVGNEYEVFTRDELISRRALREGLR